ncbi:MAG TPA: T9SS type A sorting domain-containing protein [Flavobacteriales bacterium]|jgi:uncharacterized delta-60 repeat protein|nr:T9SS type A sorting domain-containing protein [Flavobacteriales bacterium]MBK8533018.1 T9SS type A sorting domain-containing protein [Flavobacteriales bacterium]MBK8707499.1 T9SS type A sorting domain-containing protein [Flavobacteriales bacterium]MCC7501876.1 T9SS type A sorting domain-containing protein [Flavobacteriales bacterium]HQV40362.1 T9SS type A sorting domain-containing protein [Flavobacteriales bacterium]
MRTSLLLSVALFPLASLCQDGVLDPSFSGDGIATHGFGLANDVARKVIQQPDGRILVGGNTFVLGASAFGVARLLENGELDVSFAEDGYTVHQVSSMGDAAFDMALQPDGKVLLAGVSSEVGSNGIGLMRFEADGELDMGFGTEGVSIANIPGQSVEIYGVALQADGKIVVCGMAFSVGGQLLVARFDDTGALDLSFNSTGYTLVPIGEYAVAYDVAIRPDGRIIAAGHTETNGNASLALAQLDTDGALDASFGTDGIVTTELGYSWERINGFTLDPDGALIGVGTVGMAFDFDTFDAIAVRYLLNGTLDTSFGTNGLVIMDHSDAENGAYDAALQGDGKILICGGADVVGQYQFALTRLLTTGMMDNTFGTGGTVLTAVGTEGSEAYSITMQSDGRILVSGTSGDLFGADFAVARYTSGLADGILEAAAPLDIVVFPNPATERISVQHTSTTGTVALEVIDTEGRVVLQHSINATQRIELDVRALADGRYVLHLIDGKARYAGSFVKVQ